MCTTNPYRSLVKIARHYIDFSEGELLYGKGSLYVHNDPLNANPYGPGEPLNIYLLGEKATLKKDFLDLRKGMGLKNWRMACCPKHECKYCEGEGCFFFTVKGRWTDKVIYDTKWMKDITINYRDNTVGYYQKRVNMTEIPEISEILNQDNKEKQIKQLQTEIQQLKAKLNHLMFRPGGIGAEAAKEEFQLLDIYNISDPGAQDELSLQTVLNPSHFESLL